MGIKTVSNILKVFTKTINDLEKTAVQLGVRAESSRVQALRLGEASVQDLLESKKALAIKEKLEELTNV